MIRPNAGSDGYIFQLYNSIGTVSFVRYNKNNQFSLNIGGWNHHCNCVEVEQFVKGTALYTSNFTPPSAPLTSVENTKLLCCKSNSSATAADVTPGTITANGNTAATNFNPFTVNINTQRGQESGYATLNPSE
jgi:hypothetical protein